MAGEKQKSAAAAPDAPAPAAAVPGHSRALALMVSVPEVTGELYNVKIRLKDVADLMERLQNRALLADLRLGQQDGITAEAFYYCCAASIQQQKNGQRADCFVLDRDAERNPPAHRLIRLELLSAMTEVPDFKKPDSSLSDGARKLLACLWRHAKWKGSWTQAKAFCNHLAEGLQHLTGPSLQNKLTEACKKEFQAKPSEVPALPNNADLAIDFERLAYGKSLSFIYETAGAVAAPAGDGAAEHATDLLAEVRQRLEALETEMRSSMEALRAEVEKLRAQTDLFALGAV